jgi:hypothetical protein
MNCWANYFEGADLAKFNFASLFQAKAYCQLVGTIVLISSCDAINLPLDRFVIKLSKRGFILLINIVFEFKVVFLQFHRNIVRT